MSSYLPTASINFTLANGLGIYQGSEWSIPISITNRDESGEETPVDLTGYTGKCSIKKEANFDLPILNPEVDIYNPTNGRLMLRLTSMETEISSITGKTYNDVTTLQYDVFLDSSSGESSRILQGYVEISPSVTKENEQ